MHISIYSGMFRHVQELFRHTQNSEQPWHIQNPGIFRTKSICRYSGIFRTLGYSEADIYSEPCQTSEVERFAKIVNSYSCFYNCFYCSCFSLCLLFFKQKFFPQKYLFYVKFYVKFYSVLCKSSGDRRPWILIYPRYI